MLAKYVSYICFGNTCDIAFNTRFQGTIFSNLNIKIHLNKEFKIFNGAFELWCYGVNSHLDATRLLSYFYLLLLVNQMQFF